MSKPFRKATRRLRHGIVNLSVRMSLALFRLLPMSVARLAARGLASAVFALVRRPRQQAIANLARAFPEMDRGEITAMARRLYAHCGHLLAEVAKAPQLGDERLRELVDFPGAALWERTKAGGGLIVIGLHQGNWELMARYIARCLGHRLIVIAREQSNSGLEGMLDSMRRESGIEVAHRGEGVRPLVRALRAGSSLGVVADQSLSGALGEVSFFGHPAPAHEGVAHMARLAGAPFLTAGLLRRRAGRGETGWGGYRFELLTVPAREPGPDAPDADPVMDMTREYSEAIEGLIRRAPDQWMWFHDRWKRHADARQRLRGPEWRDLRRQRKEEKCEARRAGVPPPPRDPRLSRPRSGT